MEKRKSSGEEDGSGERGLLHTWKGYSCSLTPERLLLSHPVLQAALGSKHGVLLLEGGHVYSFGELPWKQTSLTATSAEPILEAGLSGQRVVAVAAGSFHSGAVTEDGGVHMWGYNTSGQCGLSGLTVVPNPTPVGIVDSETTPPQVVNVMELACGEEHTLTLSTHHEVWAWGSGCQTGLLTTIFPVWKPQKVEHLAGRHVLQVACGAFHSLALVRCPTTSQDTRRPPLDKCGQCHQLLYTMTDKEDHVIISDNHYCPLGVELGEEGEVRQSTLTSPGRGPSGKGLRNSPSEPILPSYSKSPDKALLSPTIPGGSPAAGPTQSKDESLSAAFVNDVEKAQVAEPDGDAPIVEQDPSTPQQDATKPAGTGTKSSPYPNEQAVKDYLKRLSDHSLAEQAKMSPAVHRPQAYSDSPDPFTSGPMGPTILPAVPVASALNSLVASCASAVGERVASTYEALSLRKVMSYYYTAPNPGAAEGTKESPQERIRLEESLQGKKSSSLGDIREEEAEGLSRRLSLPGLLSQGRYAVQLLSSYGGMCK